MEEFPSDVDQLAQITQGLIIYDTVASDFCGVDLPEERQRAIHIRPIQQVIDGILALDDRPLSVASPPDRRLAGRCHHYARLLVAALSWCSFTEAPARRIPVEYPLLAR